MEQLFEISRGFLFNPQSCYILSKELGSEFLTSLDFIENAFKLKKEGKEVPSTDYKTFFMCTDNLIGILYARYLYPELKDFVLAYSIILENYNKEFNNNSDLQNRCEFLRRISSDTSPIMEKIILLDDTSARLRAETNALNIPGFKISDHYFNLIKEEN
jgi:hypothetical protein